MSRKFTEYNRFDLSEINKEMLKKWDEQNLFRKSLETREGCPTFVFYEGPPSANGMPGIHHVIARSIKDIFCRYKTMKGFLVNRKAGWDTHGLPVELAVEKMLGITKEDIGKKISVDEYNAACRHEVMKYTAEWEDLTRKMGYWVDMDDPYITYDNRYIETLWYLLKELYKKDLLYKGYTIQPYSPAAGTGLSTHELNQPGAYRDVKDLTCVAMFKVISPLNPPHGDFAVAQTESEAHKNKLYNTANVATSEILKENAENRRKNATEAENFLWQNLDSKQLDGYKFRREHVIGDFIVDFACLSKKLVIEVDGGYHNEENQIEFDKMRSDFLNEKGFKVIRFTNEEVLYNFEKTLETIKTALRQSPPEEDLGGCYFLAWTTTPWTLPSNTALCVGEKIVYNFVRAKNPFSGKVCVYILAKERVSAYFGEKKIEEFEILGECLGKDLVGMEYEQLIPFVKPDGQAFCVISGDFVTTEDGTGIVHIAPTFGADDDKVAKNFGIAPMLLLDKNGKQVPMVDLTGKFYKIEDLDADFVKTNVDVELYKNFAGKFVKDAYYQELPAEHLSLDTEICLWLQGRGLLFKKEKHTHNYPHCWRTDKPVLYYPLDSWFIRSTAVKDEMIALNETINWKPQSTGTGRFGKWLENLNDWNLSRSRYWGTPLPIWRTEDGAEEICIGSLAELFAEIEKSIAAGFMAENPYPKFKVGDYSAENYAVANIDLHRPYVDNIILVSPSGKPMKRELDLIDVWFDSGAMPFAQVHYPFESE
jgi:isoleucyl-tRNA synthetase